MRQLFSTIVIVTAIIIVLALLVQSIGEHAPQFGFSLTLNSFADAFHGILQLKNEIGWNNSFTKLF